MTALLILIATAGLLVAGLNRTHVLASLPWTQPTSRDGGLDRDWARTKADLFALGDPAGTDAPSPSAGRESRDPHTAAASGRLSVASRLLGQTASSTDTCTTTRTA